MNNNIKISIIMPVYNVEKYVGKAIESILNQTLSEFEFLIVDDGTSDKSGEICDEYAKKDSRIQVIHKENGGAPSARNLVINLAQGKYLYFLDSDDWAEVKMLEDMYKLAETYSAQLVIAGFYIDTYYKNEKFITSDYIPQSVTYLEKEEFRKEAHKLFDKNMLYPPWNKLYLREYVISKKIYFPQTMWDDFPFNLSVVRDIERVVVTEKQYYHFLRARSESETAKYLPVMYEKREEEHGWMLELYQYWKINDLASRETIARRYIDRLIGCFENLTNPKSHLAKKEILKKIEIMLNGPYVNTEIKHVKAKTFYSKILYSTIRKKKSRLLLAEASAITFIKNKNVRLFSKLKNQR